MYDRGAKPDVVTRETLTRIVASSLKKKLLWCISRLRTSCISIVISGKIGKCNLISLNDVTATKNQIVLDVGLVSINRFVFMSNQ